MQITTTFSPGDKAWACTGGKVEQLTIGQVRVVFTESPGVEGSMFDNFSKQSGYEEAYMCVETGIGCGPVFTIGKHIFKTEEECTEAYSKHLAELQAAAEERRRHERQIKLSNEFLLRQQLAEIEELKARES